MPLCVAARLDTGDVARQGIASPYVRLSRRPAAAPLAAASGGIGAVAGADLRHGCSYRLYRTHSRRPRGTLRERISLRIHRIENDRLLAQAVNRERSGVTSCEPEPSPA